METTVRLQEPFSYALWPVIIAGGIAAAFLAYFVIVKLIQKYRAKQHRKVPVIKRRSPEEVFAIKKKYIEELCRIESDLHTDKISMRLAYQKMSICIRKFVYEMTGMKVVNYTLQEIKLLHMPVLEELISEYYTPEFAWKSSGDADTSIEKTKRVIERWN